MGTKIPLLKEQSSSLKIKWLNLIIVHSQSRWRRATTSGGGGGSDQTDKELDGWRWGFQCGGGKKGGRRNDEIHYSSLLLPSTASFTSVQAGGA